MTPQDARLAWRLTIKHPFVGPSFWICSAATRKDAIGQVATRLDSPITYLRCKRAPDLDAWAAEQPYGGLTEDKESLAAWKARP